MNEAKKDRMALIKISAKEYGLEETKAQQISDMFKPMLDKMVELEKECNEVLKLPISQKTIEKAKELRLKYVKVRTGTVKIHKELKDFYLKGGRFVDGWKNAQLMASQGIEDKLIKIEKYYENIEKEKAEKLRGMREAQLKKYIEDESVIPARLDTMEDDVWQNYLSGIKASYQAKKDAELKIEEDRIAKEIAEAEERKRIELENEKLKKEAKERDRLEKIEAEKREKVEAERKVKEEAEQKKRDEKERKEREAHQAEIDKEKRHRDHLLKIEESKRAKVEAELKAKNDAEEKAESERKAKIEAELSKGDEEKVKDLVTGLLSLTNKYDFKSEKNKIMYLKFNSLIGKLLIHMNWNKK